MELSIAHFLLIVSLSKLTAACHKHTLLRFSGIAATGEETISDFLLLFVPLDLLGLDEEEEEDEEDEGAGWVRAWEEDEEDDG